MSRLTDELDRIDRIRVIGTRALLKGQMTGLDLLEFNQKLDETERKVKSRIIAIAIRMRDQNGRR